MGIFSGSTSVFAFLMGLSVALGGCKSQETGSSFVQKARSLVDSDLKVVACASKNNAQYAFYGSLQACENAWPGSPGGCSGVVVVYQGQNYFCIQHALSEGGGGAGGGDTESKDGSGSKKGPLLSWSGSHDFGFLNANDSASVNQTKVFTVSNSGGAASGCKVEILLDRSRAASDFEILYRRKTSNQSNPKDPNSPSCASMGASETCYVGIKTAVPSEGQRLTGGLKMVCDGGAQAQTERTHLKANGSYSTLRDFYSRNYGSVKWGIRRCGFESRVKKTRRVYHRTPIASGSTTPVFYDDGKTLTVISSQQATQFADFGQYKGVSCVWSYQSNGSYKPHCQVGSNLPR